MIRGENGLGYVPAKRGTVRQRRTIEYLRFPSQQKFDELRVMWKGFSGSIGSGKSVALVHEAIKLAYLNPGVMGLVGAPTYRMLADSTMVEMFATLDAKQIPYTFRKSSYSIFLHEPKSTILCRTMDDPERMRAMNLGWFGIDELSYCKEAAWTRLEGRLRHPKAKVKCGFAVWTPKGKDWVWRRFISTRKQPNYSAVLARPFENRAVLDSTPDFYDNLKMSYDEKFYRQEVLGEYLDMFSGSVYHAYSEKNIRPAIFDSSLPLLICMDFNYSPMAGCVCQQSTSFGYTSIQVLQEIVLPSSHAAAWCQEMLVRTASMVEQVVRTGRAMEMHFYGDASGGSHSAQTADSTWQIVQKFMSQYPHIKCKYLYKKKNPLVVDRVNAVNAMLCSFGGKHENAGEVRLFVDPSCRVLMTDFEDVTWKVDSNGAAYGEIDKTNLKLSHASDSVGYLCESLHGIANVGHAVRHSF